MSTHDATRFSSLRLASRLARRETVRRPWRSLLVALLVAIPVAGMTVAAVWVRTDHQSPLEQWRASAGHADLYATPGALGGAPRQVGAPTLDELLPSGSRSVAYRSEFNRLLRTTAGDRSSVEVSELPMADPLTAPIIQVTSGRPPTRSGEVFVTRQVARDLDLELGDTVTLERPTDVTWTVVGVGEKAAWWGASTVVLGPRTTFPWRDDGTGFVTRTVLVDLPDDVTAAQFAQLARFADGVAFAPGVAPPDLPGGMSDVNASEDTGKVAWSWVIGAVVLTVVGIVIAAAFAAGARRQLTTLGQLAANGAAPATLRRVLLLQGTWTGLLGVALGLGLAGATLAAAAPHVDNLLNRDVDPYTFRLADLIPIAVLGVTAATLAALVPARTTSRIPVLAALAGRRPLCPVPGRLTAAGAAAGAAGLALLGLAALGANSRDGGTVWALTAVVGGVAILLGTCAVAPGYVSALEPLAGRLRGSSRLAARSLARQRTRTGAVVSAVCATSALAIGASALVLSADAKDAGEPQLMRPEEIHLSAHATGPVVGEGLAPESRPVAVPDDYLDELRAAIAGTEVHHVEQVGVAGASADARWEVRDFTPAEPLAEVEPPLHLQSGPYPQFAAIADELLDLYDLPAGAIRALDQDGVVALGYLPVGGTARVALVAERRAASATAEAPTVQELVAPFPVEVVPDGDVPLGSVPRILMTPSRATDLGLAPSASLTVVRAPRSLSDADRAALQDITTDYGDASLDARQPGGEIVSLNYEVAYPSNAVNPRLAEALLSAAALALSLFVVGVSLALAAAETRDERDILVVVGAPPPTMRRTSGHKALLLTLLGAALAVPVGFLPVSVFTAASETDLPLVFPWRVVLLLVGAVPIVAALATTASSAIALRLRPVRVSTMAFD
ncbi:MAG TPA: FtsX-like permease family protein [Acidimicrobiales bacterium]|nr:FtsX-like permease family protein [Acidimicrobiales bacterium]